MARDRRSTRSKAVNRLVPAGYAAMALLVVAFVLPSALRPPPDTTQSGSEYSPDAPPNAKAQSLIKTQFQPGSNTAGQEGAGKPTPPPTAVPVATPPEKTGGSTVTCATNWDPPRQWDSVYAPPCQAAFIGNNGGSTQPGVTSTTYSMVVSFYGQQQTDGVINDATARSSAQLRTLNDIQKYFNKHAMTYNRKLQLAYATEGSATADESTQRSDTTDAISKYHPIAAQIEGTQGEIDEYAKAHVVNDSWLAPIESYYQARRPVGYSWSQVSPTLAAKLTAEWICKQVKGHPPIAGVRTGNATFDPKKDRTWGAIEIALPWANSGPTLLSGLKTCGVAPLDQAPGVDMANEIQQALLKLQSENVSSVILNTDIVDAMAIEIQAEGIGYYPEWITTGWGGLDQDAYLTRDVPVEELGHTFGLNIAEVNLAPSDMECYKAVASVDSGYVAHPLYCHIYWEMISHAVAAVQLNGPHLTRESLAKAYLDIPAVGTSHRESWAMVGDYDDPGRRSFPKAASVYWWDPDHLDADESMGTYAYADCGQRYTLGHFPSRPAHIFTKTGYVTGRTFYSKCTPPSGAAAAPAIQTPLTQGSWYVELSRPAAVLNRRTVGA
ncbi:MAG TPA: hypothetical protein VL281_02055 [Mycobacteriales bacterium]|nr:hypothetical protein [Mycobacteriales bacterium]